MSIKLSVGMKDRIVKSVLDHKFKELEVALEAKKLTVADQLYNLMYSQETREKMYNLPEGWLPTHCSIDVQIPGHCWSTFYFNHDSSESRRFLNKDRNDFQCEIASAAATLAMGYLQERDTINKEKEAAKRQAYALLHSVTTVNRAIEVWKEAEKFIREAVGVKNTTSKAALPMVLVSELNAALNLPPKDTE